MAYFSNMPVIDYPLSVNGRVKYINSRNIMVRAKFLDYIKQTQQAYLNYTIRDGERPETLAHRIYGASEFHWIILLFNEIIDPIFSWPIASNDLDALVEKKYNGKTLFIDMKRVNYQSGGQTLKGNEEVWYEVGSAVTQGTATGTVLEWDPNLYKIVIDQTSTQNFKTTIDIDNPLATNRDLIHIRKDGIKLASPLGRVVDNNKYAAHHFVYDDTNAVVDHHRQLQDVVGSVVNSSIIDRYATYRKDNISLVVDGTTRNIRAISNYQYEIEKNDNLRSIKLMRPELIDVVVKDLKGIFSA
jgi:hypothetical protein